MQRAPHYLLSPVTTFVLTALNRLSGELRIMNVDSAPGRNMQLPVCTLVLPEALPKGSWPGPRINLALPSFRWGLTRHLDGAQELSC